MSVSPEFNETLHPREKGKFTNKPQSAGTTILTAPVPAEDFDRSLPQFEGWPESLAEPTMDFSINDDGTVGTKLKVAGQGELDFYSDSSGRADHEHYAGNFENINEDVLDQAVEWGYDKHLEIEKSVRAEMKAAADAARGRILAGAGMKVASPTNEELNDLIQQTFPLRANAEQTSELASATLMARNILDAHPNATHAEILIDEGDGTEFVSGVAVLGADREILAEYDFGSGMFGDGPVNSQTITDPLANLNPSPTNAHWERYTSENFGSVEEMQRDAYIIDLTQAAAWIPGT